MALKSKGDDVFVDSNFFCAFYNPKDTLHAKALNLAGKLKLSKARLWISNYIFLEVVTIISQRVGKKWGITIGEKIKNVDFVSNIHIDESMHCLSWELFKQVSRKDPSFVDVSIIAAMKAENIRMLLTFDKDLTQIAKSHKIKVLQS